MDDDREYKDMSWTSGYLVERFKVYSLAKCRGMHTYFRVLGPCPFYSALHLLLLVPSYGFQP